MSQALTYQPLHPETLTDPFPVFAALQESTPVLWHDQLQSWVVSRHADCQEVLRNHQVFARDPRRAGRQLPAGRENIQTQDPPDQLELRKSTARALNKQDLPGICASARRELREALSARASTGPFNLMTVAAPAAMDIINTVVGTAHYDAASYEPIFRGLTQAMDSGLDPSRLDPGRAAGRALSDSVRSWFSTPAASGMIGELQRDETVAAMPPHYVHNTIGGVFNAGFSTLYASTGSVALLLLQRPWLLEPLLEPALTATGVEELFRFLSPAQATSRYAVADTTLGGTRIPAGSTVVVLMAAANRDPRAFDAPDEIRLERSPNPHLGFAWGPHLCLGLQLATQWAVEVVRLLHDLRDVLTLAGEPTYMNTATLRNVTHLPVTVTT